MATSFAAGAWACPDCLPGRIARARVIEQSFSSNLAITVAPFLVLVGLAVLVERIGAGPRPGKRG